MTKSGWLPIGSLHIWMDWNQISINGVIIRFWKTQNLPDFNLPNVAQCFPFKIISLAPLDSSQCCLKTVLYSFSSLQTLNLWRKLVLCYTDLVSSFQVSSWMFQMFVGAEFMVVPPMARLHIKLICGVYRAQRNGFTSYTFFFFK